ncbi:hypothetical protein [Sphingobium yanoikuyae]|uniref:hypothetical protein n=1 Tax=Sphingobium yanoikuyae TaxID=13690 RepID=UPI002FD9461A
MQLIASRPFTYATRRLKVGDYFFARTMADHRALVATGRAKIANIEATPDQKPDAATDILDKLRAEYSEVVGKRPYHGWDAETLAAKISEARTDD